MSETVTTAATTQGFTPAAPKEQVPALAPPRLPYHPIFQERFNVDRAMWKALVEAVWPLAKTPESIALALAYCQAKQRDPFKRVVHIVPMWNSTLGRMVETVWPGIADHRITASRTGEYAGADPTSFGDWIEKEFVGTDRQNKEHRAKIRFPEWAQMTLYRVVKGARVPFPGPRCYFYEYFSSIGDSGVPNDKWTRSPAQMLEKCAEAQALRKAFPEELGGEATAEEMEGRVIEAGGVITDPQHMVPPRPIRGTSEFERKEPNPPTAPAKPNGGHEPVVAPSPAQAAAASHGPPEEGSAPVTDAAWAAAGFGPGGTPLPAQSPEPTEETALDRGIRLLALCKTVADVGDLRETIAQELPEAEQMPWSLKCGARSREIADAISKAAKPKGK